MNAFRTLSLLRNAAVAGLVVASIVVCRVSMASKVRADELVQSTLQLDADASRGAASFATNCAHCHGNAALGDTARAIPSLAGQRKAYLVKQMADFREREREGLTMHGVVSQRALAGPQSWVDVAAYLSNLPPLSRVESGDGSMVELGEAIYHEQCASCHADDARGDDEGFVPALRNQHYSYLVRQMRSISTWHRANVEPDLVRFLASLPEDEASAVSDYLSRLDTPVRDRAALQPDGTLRDASEPSDTACQDDGSACVGITK